MRLLAALIAALLLALAGPAPALAAPASAPAVERVHGDVALYRAVAHKVAHGEGYYNAVAELYRAHHYPTRPFVAVRPPLLAWIEALVGDAAMPWLGLAATLIATGLWMWRLRAESLAVRFVGTGAVLASLACRWRSARSCSFTISGAAWSSVCALACDGPLAKPGEFGAAGGVPARAVLSVPVGPAGVRKGPAAGRPRHRGRRRVADSARAQQSTRAGSTRRDGADCAGRSPRCAT